VAVLAVGVLMYFRDTDQPNPFEMVATLLEPMPSGSCLAVTHPTPDFNPEETARAAAAAEAAGVTLVPRTKAEIEGFFSGLDLVDPGVTPVLSWRPDEPPADPRSAYYWAGVGRKP
jgi:S-adenosyl methyltransferase